MKQIQRLALITVAILSLGASAGWQRLGRLDVGLPADHDALTVSRRVGALRELMLEARGDDVAVSELVVSFDDGTTFKPQDPIKVREGSKGEVVNFAGKRARVRTLGFTYAPANGKEKVQLTVYGR